MNDRGTCLYLNSGDWREKLSALEYSRKRWELYRFSDDKPSVLFPGRELPDTDPEDVPAALTIISN